MHEKEFFYTDNIREAGIRAALGQELRDLPLQVLPVVDSTNIRLRKMAEDGAPDGMALIAGAQTAGKGRLGRGGGLWAGRGARGGVLQPVGPIHACGHQGEYGVEQ